ncbi:hypothetical protein LXA43DRAFT_1102374 [Ganoderma leucocontextum]|nr:hypothetical protein LXA43DRAFT_1102374 [Ganoderma leucocontextum]
MASSPNANATTAGVAPVLTIALPALDNTYGAIMLGTFGGLMTYGLTMHQGYRYMHLPYYKQDATYIKAMVALVLLIETVHSVLSMHACYYYFATNYFHPEILFHGSWSINLLPMSTGVVIAVSQSFFARRLFKINPRYAPIVGFVVLLLLGELAATVEAFIQPDLLHYQKFSWMISTALGMVIAADGILTVLLTIVLHRSRTGFKSTDSMINVLIMYTINTGLLTGTISTISFFMVCHAFQSTLEIFTELVLQAVFYPDTLIDDGLNLFAAKLYANSLLAVLNSRHFLSSYGKSDYEATPSKISAIHRSALVSNSSDVPACRDVLANSQHVLDIRVTSESQRDASFNGDTVFTDRKPDPSIELQNLRDSPKGDDASQDAASHDEP